MEIENMTFAAYCARDGTQNAWSFFGHFYPPSPIVVLRVFFRETPLPKKVRGFFEKKMCIYQQTVNVTKEYWLSILFCYIL